MVGPHMGNTCLPELRKESYSACRKGTVTAKHTAASEPVRDKQLLSATKLCQPVHAPLHLAARPLAQTPLSLRP
jgi:hypothetical protein